MTTTGAVSRALAIRDDSIRAVLPHCSLPEPLPLNVQNIPNQALSEEELQITSCDAVALVQRIASKEWSCETVVMAFLRRAAFAQKTTNCITELLWSHAIYRAKYLDSLPHPAGPLHGLPISMKEQFGVPGKLNNNGFVAWCDRMQLPDCTLYDAVEGCGAIVFARTTEPQSVMHLETSSNIYGRTVNPWNRDLAAGGSSGGEGALVAFNGSPLGLGGDIGGSIRVPAANTGVYGFKPSPFRVGNTGGMGLISGQEGVIGCIGPLSPTLAGIEMFMKAYLGTTPWVEEDYLIPMPWREVQLSERLKIGIMWSDGIVRPHPPILRALREVVKCLTEREEEFEIVDWQPLDHDECWEITSALYYEDGGNRLKNVLCAGGEEPLPLTQWLLDQPEVKPRTVEEVWQLKARRNGYRSRYNQHWLDTGKHDGHPVDAIICPAGPGCAPPHDHAKYWNYTSQWNLLEYPAIVFPRTRVDPQLDVADLTYVPRNEADKFNHSLYTGPDQYKDAPVSLQLVTRRYEDEKCIAVLKRIETALQSV